MARLAYNTRGCAGSRGFCNTWWAIDYPYAEIHFLPAVTRMTRIETSEDSAHVQAFDDSIFDYPWLFVQQIGQGNWNPSIEETERLREYLLRGGFLVVDDFHGEYDWSVLQAVMANVLPGRAIVDIPENDMLLRILFELDERTQIPGQRHLGWQRMEGPPHWRGIYDDHGRLMVAINHNIDMGDALGTRRRRALPGTDDGDRLSLRHQLRHLCDDALTGRTHPAPVLPKPKPGRKAL